MPPPLQFTGAQAAIARNIQQQHNMMAQAQLQAAAQHQQQQAIAAFVGAIRTATPALTAMAGVARSAASQASFGARVGYGAVNYVARNIGSASGSSFLERRLDWALFGVGTAGAGAIGRGLFHGIQAGELSYSTQTGLSAGASVTNSITYGVLGAIYKATGISIQGQGALMGAEEQTKSFTSEIARYGGKVLSLIHI